MSAFVNISHPTGLPNFTRVNVGEVSFYFSYETVVGVTGPTTDHEWIARENDWGPTTGKHLAYFSPDKKARLPRAEFEAVLAEALNAAGLVSA